MERETGIEPATNSLEGCDSTTELLPPSRLAVPLRRRFGEASPRRPSFHVNRPASLSGPGAPASQGGLPVLVARFTITVAFGRRCIPPRAAMVFSSAGSNTPGIVLPRALRAGRLDALGASP